jgi:hypothetical protein
MKASYFVVGIAALWFGLSACAQTPDRQPANPQQTDAGSGNGGLPAFAVLGNRGINQTTPLLKRFDVDHNGWLDSAERKAARAAADAVSASGFGGMRGRMGGFGALFGGADSGLVAGTPGRKLGSNDVKHYGAEPLYDTGTLRTLFIEFEDSDWEQELAAFHNTDVDVPATVTVDGTIYHGVGIHFRGLTSYMTVPSGSKRSLNLSFDTVDSKQRLLGYRTLDLLNAAGDPTFLRTMLFMHVARQYYPAPQTNYVRVVINGESWGVYVNSQHFNADFTKAHNASGGARWKVNGSPMSNGGLSDLGDNIDAYRAAYEIKSKDKPKSWATLIQLIKTLNNTEPAKLKAALAPLLDVDGALRFLAVDKVLSNSDGYWTRNSDYSIYSDDRGIFHVTAHDANETFEEPDMIGGVFNRGRSGGQGRGMGGANTTQPDFAALRAALATAQRSGPGTDLDALAGADDPSKALLYRLLAVPEFKQQYLRYVRDIADQWLDWNRLGPLAVSYQALIATDVKLDTRKLYATAAFNDGVYVDHASTGNMMAPPAMSLKSFVTKRREYLLRAIGTSR